MIERVCNLAHTRTNNVEIELQDLNDLLVSGPQLNLIRRFCSLLEVEKYWKIDVQVGSGRRRGPAGVRNDLVYSVSSCYRIFEDVSSLSAEEI